MNIRPYSLSLALLIAGAGAGASPSAFAQAWVGAPNSLSLGVGYNFVPSTKIVESDGQAFGNHPITHHGVVFNAEYVTPLPGLAISASLPLLALTYKGEGSDAEPKFARHGRYDDGKTHLAVADLRADIRYMPISDPIALSIRVGGSFPLTDYEVVGFATAGRHILMGHFGVALGYVLWDFFLHAQYEFTLGQRIETDIPDTEAISQDRSDVNAQLGYFIIEGLEVHAAFDWRIPHGGINFVEFNDLSQAERDFHDVLLREGFILVGGGASYEIVEGLSIEALFRIFVTGTNTRNGHVFGGGITYEIF